MSSKKPFICRHNRCNKAYTTSFSLRRHMTTHQSDRKFSCPTCGKQFALAQYLKEHMYIHNDQKPFRCDYPGCNMSFRQAGKLSLHKKTFRHNIFLIEKVMTDSTSTRFSAASQPQIQHTGCETSALLDAECS